MEYWDTLHLPCYIMYYILNLDFLGRQFCMSQVEDARAPPSSSPAPVPGQEAGAGAGARCPAPLLVRAVTSPSPEPE